MYADPSDHGRSDLGLQARGTHVATGKRVGGRVAMKWFTIAYTREGADRIHAETAEHANESDAWRYAADMADSEPGYEVEVMPHYFTIPSNQGHSYRHEARDARSRTALVGLHHKAIAARERLRHARPTAST